MSARLAIVPLADEHVTMLAEFYRVAWQSTATVEEVRRDRQRSVAHNHADPGMPLPAAIAVQGNTIVGYCGTLAVRYWDGHRERPGYWAKGLMVLPAFQNGPIGFMLLKEVSKCAPLMGAFTVNPAANRLFGALGYRDVGPVPNRVKPIRLAGIMRTLDAGRLPTSRVPQPISRLFGVLQRSGLAWLVGAAGDVVARVVMPRIDRALQVSLDARVTTADLDALWRAASTEFPAATVRDGSAFVTRYGDGASNAAYRIVTVHRHGALVACAVIRRPREVGDPRLAGVRVASLSDLLVRPTDRAAVLAVLDAAENSARALGADAVWCSASAQGLAPVLARRGYVAVPSNIRFFLKAPAADADAWHLPVQEWWLTRGDSEADLNF